jgi:hypothetical protein
MSRENPFARNGTDRRKHLRLTIRGTAVVEYAGAALSVPCSEFSLGGALVHPPQAWTLDADVLLKSLEVDGVSLELDAPTAVSRFAETPSEDGSVATALEFVDLDVVAKSAIQAAYNQLVAPLLLRDEDDPTATMRFDWAFRDEAQLGQVCRALLESIELGDAWTVAGPGETARAYLVNNGADFVPPQRAMLRIVWQLWCGSLDIADPQQELSERAQGSIAALKKAFSRGPTGIDEWLRVERR